MLARYPTLCRNSLSNGFSSTDPPPPSYSCFALATLDEISCFLLLHTKPPWFNSNLTSQMLFDMLDTTILTLFNPTLSHGAFPACLFHGIGLSLWKKATHTCTYTHIHTQVRAHTHTYIYVNFDTKSWLNSYIGHFHVFSVSHLVFNWSCPWFWYGHWLS